jgi:hypothetical protein
MLVAGPMFSFVCPNCNARLSLDDDARGRAVICGVCAKSVYIAATDAQAAQPADSEPAPVAPALNVIERPLRRRKKSPLATAVNICVHLAISATAVYAVYLLWARASSSETNTKTVVNRVEPGRSQPPIVRKKPQPRIIESRPEDPKPAIAAPAEPEPPPESPLNLLPAVIDLPAANDDNVAILCEAPSETEVDLLSNDENLHFLADKVQLQGKTVAGLRLNEGLLEFRWTSPSPEAEAAVRNAILRLSDRIAERYMALRSPLIIAAPKLELKAPLRINGKCDAPPPSADVRFAFELPLPIKSQEGADAAAMQNRDEAVLRYNSPVDVATRVRVRAAANVLAAEFETQYVLPSGDVEPLSISKGNRKLRELENLEAAAQDAHASIERLKSYQSRLGIQLQRAMNINTMVHSAAGSFENPALAAQKAAAIARIRDEIIATERNIARAQQLIDDHPAISRDLAAIKSVAEFAQSLKATPVPYTFYTMVAGQRVDLIIAE